MPGRIDGIAAGLRSSRSRKKRGGINLGHIQRSQEEIDADLRSPRLFGQKRCLENQIAKAAWNHSLPNGITFPRTVSECFHQKAGSRQCPIIPRYTALPESIGLPTPTLHARRPAAASTRGGSHRGGASTATSSLLRSFRLRLRGKGGLSWGLIPRSLSFEFHFDILPLLSGDLFGRMIAIR